MGFVVDGTAWESNAPRFTLVIPTSGEFDATMLNTSRLYVGNTGGVAVPVEGRPVTSGIYFVRTVAGSYQEVHKIVMLK